MRGWGYENVKLVDITMMATMKNNENEADIDNDDEILTEAGRACEKGLLEIFAVYRDRAHSGAANPAPPGKIPSQKEKAPQSTEELVKHCIV